ncbi:hypothetical protein DU478_08245 [Thalassococcus profundi]|jgi:hypothetical protein|uniref:Uncharacterized protein n=1 Tax=Thalassococcus profundi TaxID=2282382 RepID=A0A369TQD7_9RHOB|nr:hypothetical protein DU478_08245 [Thalassococcus profundi]
MIRAVPHVAPPPSGQRPTDSVPPVKDAGFDPGLAPAAPKTAHTVLPGAFTAPPPVTHSLLPPAAAGYAASRGAVSGD